MAFVGNLFLVNKHGMGHWYNNCKIFILPLKIIKKAVWTILVGIIFLNHDTKLLVFGALLWKTHLTNEPGNNF